MLLGISTNRQKKLLRHFFSDVFSLREAFSSAIASVTGILPTLANKADYSKVRTTEGATMKDENRGTVSQSASTGSTAKSEAVTYEKPWGVQEVLFFGGEVNKS